MRGVIATGSIVLAVGLVAVAAGGGKAPLPANLRSAVNVLADRVAAVQADNTRLRERLDLLEGSATPPPGGDTVSFFGLSPGDETPWTAVIVQRSAGDAELLIRSEEGRVWSVPCRALSGEEVGRLSP